jgi:phosphate transport system substrate-binding protein
MATLAPVRAEPVTGAGSTFVYPLLGHWAERFRTTEADGGDFPAPESGLDYEPVGSLAGTMRVIARAVDFGASDAPLKTVDVDRHGLAQFPITMGGIAIAINVAGVENGALRLSGSALAGIYLGTIANWSDPALKALNPGLRLPDAPIMVVHRSDGSGTTYNFAAYLAHASTSWRERVGIDTELKWPAGSGAKGSTGMIEAVQKTQNAIGYVEFGQAIRVGLATARIENRAGQFVAPSRASIEAAGTSMDWAATKHFDRLLTEASGPEAYPIAATVFALMPRELANGADAKRALRFFEGGLTRWQQDAAELGYVPLPDALVTQVRSYWTAMAARLN